MTSDDKEHEAGTPEMLWSPTPEQVQASVLWKYSKWLEARLGLSFASYEEMWRWSVNDLSAFWPSVWEFFDVKAEGSFDPVLGRSEMPGAEWFPNARLNYAEQVFEKATAAWPAMVVRNEESEREVTWAELQRSTATLAKRLRDLGVGSGDRIAAYLPSRFEAVVAFLACSSIGAIWSSCAPDMGESIVVDRFGQIEPKVLLAVDSYSYNGKVHDRAAVVAALIEKLPSLASVIHVPGPLSSERPVPWTGAIPWPAGDADAKLTFERVPFGHPLWIVYSSGTTGLPKAMVHGHGGIVLTHLKTLILQHDLRPADRMLFLGSTGWIVWNHLVGGLLTGATIVLYDGNPAWPDTQALWRFMDRHGVTLFGCGATFLVNCMKAGLRPRDFVALDRLRAINSTGSPLPEEGFRWVYDAIKPNLWLASVSGGTDIASGFVACSPTLPVYAGEIQCRELGVAAYAFDDAGQPVTDKMGELVVTKPMPSMPVRFWNDPGNRRYLESYFEMFPGVWRQGDWIRITSRGTCVIYGRSDTTINRHGIRIGTAEIYRVVEELPEVLDSLVVDLEFLGRESFMPLFVVLVPGIDLDDRLKTRITDHIRRRGSARHVPTAVYRVDEVPRTLTGKKMELPVRKLLLGSPADKVASPDAMLNPGSLAYFVDFAAGLGSARAASDRIVQPPPGTRLPVTVEVGTQYRRQK